MFVELFLCLFNIPQEKFCWKIQFETEFCRGYKFWHPQNSRNRKRCMNEKSIGISVESIEKSILLVRGHKVMFDYDLADLYDVPTKTLKQAVRRNIDRFPADFMFELTHKEFAYLRSQIVTSSSPQWGGRRYTPMAFTEQGVAMFTPLNSKTI